MRSAIAAARHARGEASRHASEAIAQIGARSAWHPRCTARRPAMGIRADESASKARDIEARWAALGSRERADSVLLRARLVEVAREGERDADRERMPALEPLAALIERLRSMATRLEPAAGVERAVELLASDDALRAGVRRYVARIARSARVTGALADLGIFPGHGLGAELRERLVSRVLPSYRPPEDLGEILDSIFCGARDCAWLEQVPDALLAQLFFMLAPDDELARGTLEIGVLRAIDLLSHRLAAAGEDPLLHWFDPQAKHHESPFLAQADYVLALTAARRARYTGEPLEPVPVDEAHARVLLTQCREAAERIRKRAPRTGATLRLGYELARIDDLIDRLTRMLETISEDDERAGVAQGRMVRTLLEAQIATRRIAPLLGRASRLAAAEVVSHAGRTGAHYITRTRSEYARMWLAAMGAGAIVALLANIKVGLAALHAAPLIEAVLFSANYSIGFIVVHLLGMTIATKQPAMTAASLARSIDQTKPRETRPLVETVMCLVRSQLAAIAGNVVIALPAAWLLARALEVALGAPVAGVEKAEHLVHEIDPLHSPAVLHAAITGIWLTLSGIAAGYASSAVLARHVADRIQRAPRLLRWMGPERLARFARSVEQSSGPVVGSIVLGTLLGSTGFVGEILGLPIDIRHVSFASANLGIALATLGIGGVALGTSLTGIALIGLTNLAVSFGSSLALALHGRQLALPGLARDLARSALFELPAWLLPVGPTASPVPEERSSSPVSEPPRAAVAR